MRKLFPKLNISRQLLSRGVSLVVVFATLVAAYAALSLNMTLGWFSESTSAHANGMSAQVYESAFEVTYTPVTITKNASGELVKTLGTPITGTSENDFAGELVTAFGNDFNALAEMFANVKVPGQTVYFEVAVKNIGQSPAVITGIGLDAPGATDDVPVRAPAVDKNGNEVTDDTGAVVYADYYLSTQLTTFVYDAKTDPGADMAVQSSTAKQLRGENGSADQIDYLEWLGIETITLDVGQSVKLTIAINFVDTPNVVQNQYKNYVESGGVCRRKLFITHQ